MEMLSVKRVYIHGAPVEIRDIWLERKVCFLEEQTKRLKEACLRLYQSRVYKQKPGLSEQDVQALKTQCQEICEEICRENWTEQVWLLNTFKAKAGCFLGCVHVCCRNYDEALEYLSAAKEQIETETLQYIIPEVYVRVCIEMAKCYIEKHNPKEVLRDCLNKAEEILYASQEEICNNYQKICLDKLSLDLKLQEAFTEMDKYSGDSCNEKAADRLLQEAAGIYAGLPVHRPDTVPENFCYEAWKAEKEVTLKTTRGELFKNLYFQAGQRMDLLDAGKTDPESLEKTREEIAVISSILNMLESKKFVLLRSQGIPVGS